MESDQHREAGLNPYESPAVADGRFSDELAGVGIWRDGKNLVMHQRAQLPRICIKTGQPAERFLPFKLRWYYPIDWSTRKLRVEVPFCDAAYRASRRKRLIGTVILVCTIVFLVGSQLLLMINRPQGLFMLLASCGFAAGGMLRSPPLKFVRVRGEYLWFSGAGNGFLAKLPDWMFGH
jgi:hypothetical protein